MVPWASLLLVLSQDFLLATVSWLKNLFNIQQRNPAIDGKYELETTYTKSKPFFLKPFLQLKLLSSHLLLKFALSATP